MKRQLNAILPAQDKLHEQIRRNRWLSPLASRLLHPTLWHLNRHSVARGFAIGLFCGLIPGPFQMLAAAIVCLFWRANLPLAMLTTLYTNPLTLVPIYGVAYTLGNRVLSMTYGMPQASPLPAPPDFSWSSPLQAIESLTEWLIMLGQPLALGLLLLAITLGVLGYFVSQLAWRLHLIHRLRLRRRAPRP